MKILTIPDVHNKIELIEYAEKLAGKHSVNKLVFLGDLFDDWNRKSSGDYRETIKKISKLHKKLDCHFVLGNHDAPYLLGIARHYSVEWDDLRSEIRDFLVDIKPTLAYSLNGWTFSHAGVTSKANPDKRWFEDANKHYRLVKSLEGLESSTISEWEAYDESPLWKRGLFAHILSTLSKLWGTLL